MTGLHCGVGALPPSEELAAGVGQQKEHAVDQLELPGLCWPVVDPASLCLGLEHVLVYDEGYFFNTLLHLPTILDD